MLHDWIVLPVSFFELWLSLESSCVDRCLDLRWGCAINTSALARRMVDTRDWNDYRGLGAEGFEKGQISHAKSSKCFTSARA